MTQARQGRKIKKQQADPSHGMAVGGVAVRVVLALALLAAGAKAALPVAKDRGARPTRRSLLGLYSTDGEPIVPGAGGKNKTSSLAPRKGCHRVLVIGEA